MPISARLGLIVLLIVAAVSVVAQLQPRPPALTPPPGLRVWPAVTFEPIRWTLTFQGDGAPTTMRLVGPRNGFAAGQMVASDGNGLEGLTATLSDLRGPGGEIPAAAFRILYGRDSRAGEPVTSMTFYPVLEPRAPAAPVVPIWLVADRLPADKAPGLYAGTLTLAAGAQRVVVPVELTLGAWVAPDPAQFTVRCDIWQSWWSVAAHYKAQPWSPEHIALVERSLRRISRFGTKTVNVQLIANASLGQTQALLRVGPDGTLDTAGMATYLRLWKAHVGTPRLVMVQLWTSNGNGMDVRKRSADPDYPPASSVKPMRLTGLDGAEIEGPRALTREGAALMTAAVAAVRAEVKQLGWDERVVMAGFGSDARPSEPFVQWIHELVPDLQWVHIGHDYTAEYYGVPVGYCANMRPQGKWVGKPWYENPFEMLDVPYDSGPSQGLAWMRCGLEHGLRGGKRGMAHVPADFWTGHPHIAASQPTMRNYGSWILAPSADGPEDSPASIVLLESLYEQEARYALQRRDPASPVLKQFGRHEDSLRPRYEWVNQFHKSDPAGYLARMAALYDAAGAPRQ